MAQLGPVWGLFPATVEGREASMSCQLRDGLPYLSLQAVPNGSGPKLGLLSELFRSNIEIPTEIRLWLAEIMDPEGKSDFHFLLQPRLRRGAPFKSIATHWNAVEFFEELPMTLNRQQRLRQTCVLFKISRTTLETSIASMKVARRLHTQLLNDEEEG